MSPAWITELAAQLGLPQGDFYRRLYGFLPVWLGFTLAFGLLVTLVHVTIRSRLDALPAGRLSSVSGGLCLVLFCTVLVLGFDGAGITHGFFRQDDFSFLQVARESPDLGSQMLLRHNDHVYPLFRLQVWAVTRLAGPGAEPAELAAWFNGLTFATCLALLLSAGWLLHELGGSQLAVYLLVFGLWVWPGWGEFTSGYYTLAVYLQVQTMAAAAVAAALRSRVASAWLAISLGFVGLALALNTSGALALVAAFAISFALPGYGGTPSVRRYRLALLGMLAAFCLVYLAVAQHAPSPRELVQNPSGTMLGASIADRLRDHGIAILPAGLAGLGGTTVNLVLPTFLQRSAQVVAADLPLRWSLFGLELAFTLVLVAVAWRTLRQLGSPDRRLVLALGVTASAALAMVIIARAHYVATVPVSLWHAKYLLMPTSWLWLIAVFMLDRCSATIPPVAPWLRRTAFLAAAAGLWFTVSVRQAEQALLPNTLAYSARGRWGNAENAKTRRAEHARLMQELDSLRSGNPAAEVLLPAPETWQAEFFRHYPALEWATDFTPRGVTHLFADFPAAAPCLSLRIRWHPMTNPTPHQREKLRRIPWLESAFSSATDPASLTPTHSDTAS